VHHVKLLVAVEVRLETDISTATVSKRGAEGIIMHDLFYMTLLVDYFSVIAQVILVVIMIRYAVCAGVTGASHSRVIEVAVAAGEEIHAAHAIG
jgi:hypothetical protein